MNRYLLISSGLCISICLLAFSFGAPAGHTGAPQSGGAETCSSTMGGCHSGGSFGGNISFDLGGVTQMEPGVNYPLAVTLCYTVGSPVRAGFSMTAIDLASFNKVGTFIPGTATQLNGNNDHITHSPAQNFGANTCITYNFEYVAPQFSEVTGSIEFFAASVFGNGANGSSGDQVVVLNPQSVTLPLDLIAFDVAQNERDVLLKWQTRSEFNTDKFVVQRTQDSESWENIGWISAAGVSSQELSYEFIDRNAAQSDRLRYRLKMMDLDGQFDFSEVVTIQLRKSGMEPIIAYPNPVRRGEQIQLTVANANPELILVSSSGQVIDSKVGNDLRIETGQLNPGSYFLIGRNEKGDKMHSSPIIVLD